MSGLHFESMADMPPRMREAYARQMRDLSGAAAPAPHNIVTHWMSLPEAPEEEGKA